LVRSENARAKSCAPKCGIMKTYGERIHERQRS
jgi:hypothetical protein